MKSLGQAQLAEKLQVSTGSVGNWEIGPSQPRPETLGKIAEILGVSPSWLLYGADEPQALKDEPSKKRSESSPHKYTETATLQKTFADLTKRLEKASVHERKHILSNMREVLDELEERELKPVSSPRASSQKPEGKPRRVMDGDSAAATDARRE